MKQAIREGFIALCAMLLAGMAITTVFSLLVIWIKLTGVVLDYVWKIV